MLVLIALTLFALMLFLMLNGVDAAPLIFFGTCSALLMMEWGIDARLKKRKTGKNNSMQDSETVTT